MSKPAGESSFLPFCLFSQLLNKKQTLTSRTWECWGGPKNEDKNSRQYQAEWGQCLTTGTVFWKSQNPFLCRGSQLCWPRVEARWLEGIRWSKGGGRSTRDTPRIIRKRIRLVCQRMLDTGWGSGGGHMAITVSKGKERLHHAWKCPKTSGPLMAVADQLTSF